MSLLLTVPAAAQSSSSSQCPAGAVYTTNGSNVDFCLWENIQLPYSPFFGQVQVSCDHLHQGEIGFSWQLRYAPNYHCPSGAKQYARYGVGYCVFDTSSAPSWAGPYCDYLNKGYMGYSWMGCPPGAAFTNNGAGTDFCLFQNLSLPQGAQPYCDYLAQGYFGFSFPVNSTTNYQCPNGFTYSSNWYGLGFCLVEGLTIPQQLNVQPYCAYLQQGYIGYSFQP